MGPILEVSSTPEYWKPGPIRKLGDALRRRRHGLRDEEDRSGVHAVELW